MSVAVTEVQRRPRLTGRQKAAVFLIALGPEVSAQVMKQLSEDEIEALTLEIANVRRVDPEVRTEVLNEFRELTKAQMYIDQGGIAYAREILEKALGPGRANEVIERLTATLQVRPFEFVRRSDPGQILNFIQNEHPQTIALIMAYLNPEQAGAVLSALPPERQVDIARRVAVMDTTSPDVIREVEEVLQERFAEFVTEGAARVGGIETIVAVLNRVDRQTERTIIESLESADPELADEIKKRMFVFEDLVLLDDRSLQRVLREIDLQQDLPLALKVASDEVKAVIRRNLSERAQANLEEAISYLGPVRLRDVEQAQQRIVGVVRRLEEEGEIVISRGGEDELVV
ncbi:MAG: flagellar motor switch protein FliG [Clostridia bacterium]|nr:flagellar motor switch protein FliG [Clostridia bacterium]